MMDKNNSIQMDEIQILESDLNYKLKSIQEGQHIYQSRKLKAGNFRKNPVLIHTLPNIQKRNHYLPTADALAHRLTALSEESAAWISASIRNFVLLPEPVMSESYLLTHIYSPQLSTLAVYMYPERFNESLEIQLPDRFREAKRPVRPPLLNRVLTACQEIVEAGPAESTKVHKFVLFRPGCSPAETREMEEIEQMYNRLYPISYNYELR